MNSLVKIQNNQAVTSSRMVAKVFDKSHKHVLDSIDNIIEGVAENWATLFHETTYIHEQNKQEYRMYLMNRDGFTLLAMGFTGKKALEWKLKYIEAFNKMEKTLKSRQVIPDNLSPELKFLIKQELKTRELEEKTQMLEHRIDNLDATNIEGTPRQRLNSMIRKYAYDNGILYPNAWKEFRKNFNTAYRTNITLKKNNYMNRCNIKEMTYPAYLERVGLIEDALRVADKMLNKEVV